MATISNPPSEQLKRTEVTIRKRVECEEKAFHIINKLIDGSVTGQYLSECGKRISQENYDDVIEERVVSSLCGYPVCDQSIPNVPKKRYHISTKTNKVYDISERKNFCSNQCYKASQCFRRQIPETPMWARDMDTIQIVIPSHKGISGMVGEVVIGQHPKQVLKSELEKLKELDKIGDGVKQNVSNANCDEQIMSTDDATLVDDFKTKLVVKESSNVHLLTSTSTGDIENRLDNAFDKSFVDQPKGTDKPISNASNLTSNEEQNAFEVASSNIEKSSKMEQLQKLLNKRKNILSEMVDLQETKSSPPIADKSNENDINKSSVINKRSSSLKSVKNEEIKSHSLKSPLYLICSKLKKWVTVSTIQYLEYKSVKRESVEPLDDVTAEMSELSIDVEGDPLSQVMDDHKDEMESLCLGGSNELNERGKAVHQPTKAIPDYKTLKEESEQFHLKVTEFITGKQVKTSSKNKDEKKEEAPVYIPTVDAYDQSQIRIRIVLEKLDKSLPGILIPMGLSVQDVSTFIREMVYTFRLEKDTILFKPAEWTLVSLVLLKILSFKVKSISDSFQTESSMRYFKVVLEAIKHTMDDLDLASRNVLADAAVDFIPYT